MINNLKVCVIDDEDLIRITLEDELKEQGFDVVSFANPIDALAYINNKKINIVISDIKMPEMDGITLLRKIKQINPEIQIIIMTAYGSVNSAVEAMKLGAYDYILKPFKVFEVITKLKKMIELKELKELNQEFKQHFTKRYNINSYWGISSAVEEIKESIKVVADSDSTVLITGETGTGKELVANIIHYTSPRSNKPLIKVSCAILSKDIFESELFGHEKGAFTGADKLRIGRFEEANNGTIYLDDIDDIPLDLQVKLLRVLQENEIERLGSNKPIKINVRVIASTKANIRTLVDKGKFREDLYYRLNIFPINLPPLRERKEDIPMLLNKFLNVFSKGKNYKISEQTLKYLKEYKWAGNTRQLRNLVERFILLAKDGNITTNILPHDFTSDSITEPQGLTDKSLPHIIEQFEIQIIKKALNKAGGNKTKAAQILKIPPTTLNSKIDKYNI